MIDKETTVDQITVSKNGVVFYREMIQIIEDGEVLSKTYHRSSLVPGQDLADVPADVVAICNTAWTTNVIADYQASQP